MGGSCPSPVFAYPFAPQAADVWFACAGSLTIETLLDNLTAAHPLRGHRGVTAIMHEVCHVCKEALAQYPPPFDVNLEWRRTKPAWLIANTIKAVLELSAEAGVDKAREIVTVTLDQQ